MSKKLKIQFWKAEKALAMRTCLPSAKNCEYCYCLIASEIGIDPLDCLKRNIAKLAGRQERGTLAGNGDER